MGTPLGLQYIPYTYMDPLGKQRQGPPAECQEDSSYDLPQTTILEEPLISQAFP